MVEDSPSNMSQDRPLWNARVLTMTLVRGVPEDDWLAATIQFLDDGVEPVRLWDEYLTKAVLAARAREHAVSHQIPIFSLTANELLLIHAVLKQKNRRFETMRLPRPVSSQDIESWCGTPKQKFENKWFGPYKVLQAHPLDTYAEPVVLEFLLGCSAPGPNLLA
ncbi:hypothetical protein N7535_001246 [Penicillium sp. DV-2018c]|nr:hypothetical protein N7461_005512 [Penicillium sp. DV-2018c]KAJ5582626.1 hypothetical protein N7535_001246 [Penicillium sp. DV-2018c]